MLKLGSSLVKGGASLLTFVKDNLKLYLDFKSNKSDTLKFPSEGSTEFDGVNDYINIDGLSFSGDKGTFAFWLNSTQVSAVKHLIDIADANGGNDVQLSFQANSGNQLGIRIGASYTRYSFSNHNDGNWHYVVFVLDGTSGTIYVDGVSETKTIASSLNIVNATKAKIGSDNAGTNRFYEGKLANVAVWSRVLEPEEIQSIQNKSYSQLKGVEKTSLVAWWALDSQSDGVVQPATGETSEEKVSNTDFTTTDGWNTASGRWTIDTSAGTVTSNNDSGFSPYLQCTLPSTTVFDDANAIYKMTITIDSCENFTQAGIVKNGSVSNFFGSFGISSTGTHTVYFTNTTTFLSVYSNGVVTSISHLSVKKITSNTGLVTGATTTTSVYGGNAPILPRAVDVAKEGQADAIGNGSASFNGTSDYISLDHFSLSPSGTYTISFWFKTGVSDNGAVYTNVDGTDNYISIGMFDGHIQMNCADSGGTDRRTTGTYNDNEWHHAVLIKKDTSTCSAIYIDGVLVGQDTNNTWQGNNTRDEHVIGRARYSSTEFYWGRNSGDSYLSQLGIWKGELTQAQIQSVMESTSYSKIPADVKSTLGSEIVTNGTFDSDISNWTDYRSARGDISYSNGRLRIDNTTGTGEYYVKQFASFESGKLYKIQFDLFLISGTETEGNFYFDDLDRFPLYKSTDKVGDTYTLYASPSINRSYFIIGGASGNAFGDIFELDNITIKEVTNDIVAYYPLDAVQPSDLSAKLVPEATGGVLGAELFTGWVNNASGGYYAGWTNFTTSGQTVTASHTGGLNKVFNTNAFSIVADTAYEVNITIDSRANTWIRGLTASTNSEGSFVVYNEIWQLTSVGSSKYVFLANTTTSSARLHIRTKGSDPASITISAISIKPLSGNYGRLL